MQNIDYAPPMLDMARVPVPAEMQGASLAPLLRGESPANWRTSIYYHYYDCPAEHRVECHEGVRTEQYADQLLPPDDWSDDSSQTWNEMPSGYGDPGYAKIVTRLEKQYRIPEDPTQ